MDFCVESTEVAERVERKKKKKKKKSVLLFTLPLPSSSSIGRVAKLPCFQTSLSVDVPLLLRQT